MSTKCQAALEKARAYSKTILEPRHRSSVLVCLSSRGAYCSPEQDATTILCQFQMQNHWNVTEEHEGLWPCCLHNVVLNSNV